MKIIQLITTTFDQDVINSKECFFLGPWCKSQNINHKIPTLNYPYSNPEEVNDYINNLLILYNKYIKILSIKLNTIHHVNKNQRYWEYLVGPWLWHYIQITHERFLSIKKFVKFNNSKKVIQCNTCNIINPCFNYNSFYQNIENDKYNFQIFSDIILSSFK